MGSGADPKADPTKLPIRKVEQAVRQDQLGEPVGPASRSTGSPVVQQALRGPERAQQPSEGPEQGQGREKVPVPQQGLPEGLQGWQQLQGRTTRTRYAPCPGRCSS